MTFSLGALDNTPLITWLWFMIIIAFVVLFDFTINFLEFSLEESPRYSRMVRNIYKELMQMGIISFSVVLYDSSIQTNTEENPSLAALDFTHVLLFFVALWFVVHTFYLIGESLRTARQYNDMNGNHFSFLFSFYLEISMC